tara:strand:+ start:988 stop:1947 length:960 start_codon:yes stop_codon:yes gene_type:complete
MSLNRKFCVAPMMRYTDMHERFFLRLITKKAVLYTEMIATGALIHGNCDYQLDFNKEEHPVAVQFGGSSPLELSKCAIMAEKKGYDEINLNIGCPSERVQKGNFGVCLMLEPELVAECVRQMRRSVDIPITVKCRTGVDDNDDYLFLKSFIDIVKDSGIKTFIIHARKGILKGLSPRQNRNIPPLNYEKVYSIKNDFPNLEIVINGGIKSISEAKNHLNYVDGVMLGRAAYDNPFMLSEIDSEIYSNAKTDISRKDLLSEYLDYVHLMTEKGYDPKIMLKHVFGLKKGEKDAKRFRVKVTEVMRSPSLVENKDELLSMV